MPSVLSRTFVARSRILFRYRRTTCGLRLEDWNHQPLFDTNRNADVVVLLDDHLVALNFTVDIGIPWAPNDALVKKDMKPRLTPKLP